MLIHLIRHTTPNIDTGICYGQTDLELASSFEQEADAVLNKLFDSYDTVFTSPLKRCTQLARKLKANKFVSDKRLIEYNFGDWELRHWDDFTSKEDQQWMGNFIDQAPPNGENMVEMKQRVLEFWYELTKSNYEKVAIVCHAGVIRLIHAEIFSTPLSHVFRLQLDYGAVIEINSDIKLNSCTLKHC